MLLTYPALIYFTVEEEDSPYFVHFPDFENSATQGRTISEAMSNASEYLGMMAASLIEEGEKLPKASSINDLTLEEDFPFKDDEDVASEYNLDQSFKSMVMVDVEHYLDATKLVKKTLTIPKWANDLAVKRNINFSQLLTTAIVNEVRM